jgi:tripartite ATP-independent transporter DctP family solute receptor
LLAGAAGVVAATHAVGADAASTVTLTASDVHVPGYPTVEAVRYIGETLQAETGGRLRIRQYHSGQLGRESDAIDLTRFGALDITRVSVAALNNPFPATQALALPYVFESTAHLRRVIDGNVGDAIRRSFAARGLVGLAIYDAGARCFFNTRRPIVRPADLHGLKFRVPPSDIFMALLRALGANPTPLPYGEVFSALQTHLIDGAENNWLSFHTTRQFEAAKYWSQSGHSYTPDALLMSQRRYDALDSADRDLVRDVAVRSVARQRALWDAAEIRSRDYVLAHGVVANDVDVDAFRQAAAPVVAEFRRDPLVDGLYRGILDAA